MSGGSDGRVKVWDTKNGFLIRELSQPAEAVWRVAFESERCVVMASRGGRTIMEVWDFTPPADMEEGETEGEEGRDLEMMDAESDHDERKTGIDETYGTVGHDESEEMAD